MDFRITDWIPLGKRKMGRPSKLFRDDFDIAMTNRSLAEGDWDNKNEWINRLRNGR